MVICKEAICLSSSSGLYLPKPLIEVSFCSTRFLKTMPQMFQSYYERYLSKCLNKKLTDNSFSGSDARFCYLCSSFPIWDVTKLARYVFFVALYRSMYRSIHSLGWGLHSQRGCVPRSQFNDLFSFFNGISLLRFSCIDLADWYFNILSIIEAGLLILWQIVQVC